MLSLVGGLTCAMQRSGEAVVESLHWSVTTLGKWKKIKSVQFRRMKGKVYGCSGERGVRDWGIWRRRRQRRRFEVRKAACEGAESLWTWGVGVGAWELRQRFWLWRRWSGGRGTWRPKWRVRRRGKRHCYWYYYCCCRCWREWFGRRGYWGPTGACLGWGRARRRTFGRESHPERLGRSEGVGVGVVVVVGGGGGCSCVNSGSGWWWCGGPGGRFGKSWRVRWFLAFLCYRAA